MQSTIRPTGPIERNLHVLVEAEELNGELNEQIKSVAIKAQLPGFRKGNVPKDLIRERYGRGILAEIKVKKTEESLRDAIGKHNIRIAHISNLSYLSERDDSILEYFVDIVTEPDLVVDNLEDLNIVKPVSDITEDDIDNQLESLLDQRSEVEFVDGPIEKGHYVEYKIKDLGSKGVKEVEGLTEFQDTPFIIKVGDEENFNKDRILLIISDELLGKSKQEELVIDTEIEISNDNEDTSDDIVETPDAKSGTTSQAASAVEESDPDSKGRLNVEIHVESIQKRKHPELNDEFFKGLGRDVSNLEELRDSLKDSMAESLGRRADSLVYQQVMQQLVEMNPVDVPLETFLRGSENPENEAAESQAHRSQLLQNWIIQQYANKNDIQVAQEDLNKALMVHHQVRSALGQSTDILYTEEFQRRTHAELLSEKVLKDIVPKLHVEERSLTVAEFQQSAIEDELQGRKPNGGPFTWASPVSEDEIKQGREEVDALRARLEEPEDTEIEETAESSQEEEGKKGGLFKRLLNLVGGKK